MEVSTGLRSLACIISPNLPYNLTLSTNTSTKSLLVQCSCSQGFSALTGDLAKNTSIELATIWLQDAPMGQFSGLGKVLSTNTTISKMHIYRGTSDEPFILDTFTGIASNSTLTALMLNVERLSPTNLAKLAGALKSNTTLTYLALPNNEITHEGAKSLADCLISNKGITSLSLSFNMMGDKGIVCLAGALRQNSTLTSLDLENTDASNLGCSEVAEALKVNSSLKELLLGRNQIEEEGSSKIFEALTVNRSLKKLSLDCYSEEIPQIETALKVNSTLEKLHFSTYLSIINVKRLCRGLSENVSIRKLSLKTCTEGSEMIDQALDTNYLLTKVDIWGTDVRGSTQSSITKKCQRNKSNGTTWGPSLFENLLNHSILDSIPNKKFLI